jgi:hypothetical protein
MQKDFHHAVTYVLARLAGFSAAEGDVIAYAAEYVDDATDDAAILFNNGARYSRIASAHKMLDYRNFESLAASRVWLPFHFLPGNQGLPAGEVPEGTFVQRLITIPNSSVAQDMIRATIADRESPHGLERLGIAMHVYADTWAHQGFVGLQHEINAARNLTGANGEPDDVLLDRLKNFFVNNALPLGHGTVLSHPDRPFLLWAYTNGFGERITRNNPDDYIDAAEAMCRAMQAFRAGSFDADLPGLTAQDRQVLQRLFREVRLDDTEDRWKAWQTEIQAGSFSFGAADIAYIAEGEGSWQYEALGEIQDDRYLYKPEFLDSHWKRFNDALILHRYDVIHRILPRYGICTAEVIGVFAKHQSLRLSVTAPDGAHWGLLPQTPKRASSRAKLAPARAVSWGSCAPPPTGSPSGKEGARDATWRLPAAT